MAVTAYSTSSGTVLLNGQGPTVVVLLRLPQTGTFVVWGKVLLANGTTTSAHVDLTTLDGNTILDSAGIVFGGPPGGEGSVSLQGTLDLSQTTANEIVDIRCYTTDGVQAIASLIAIPVDALSGPAAPGT